MPDRRRHTGQQAEWLAADFLAARGYTIRERNWRRPQGELDLVADDHGTCVFVEVRSRTGDERGDPLETIDHKKRTRVIRAARLYLDELHEAGAPVGVKAYRFDAVGVTFDAAGGPPRIAHVEDAFDLG